MPGRDWHSVNQDMAKAMKNAVGFFNRHEIPLEAGPVTEVALAMFKDIRGPSAEDLINKAAGAAMELFLLYVNRCYEGNDDT